MQRSYRLPLKPCRCADADNHHAHIHHAGADADDHSDADDHHTHIHHAGADGDDHADADAYVDAESCIDVAQVREELAKSDQREVDSGTEISGNS